MDIATAVRNHIGSIAGHCGNGFWPGDSSRRGLANGVMLLAMLTGGVMLRGYALLDEIAIYLFLLWWMWRRWVSGGRLASVGDDNALMRLHRILFVTFALYCAAQAVRGVVFLDDVRVVRFVVFFVALALLAWIWPVRAGEINVRTVVLAGFVYFTAMLPAVVLVPAMATLTRDRPDRWLYWLTLSVLMLASFYYQSRFGWAAVLCLLVLGKPGLGMRRVVIG